jgi:hypothetical protein
MLGIDIGKNEIRVVNLRRRGSGFLLYKPVEVPFTAEQSSDPQELGKLLGQALQNTGWNAHKGVMTIPRQHCFIRYFDAEVLQLKNIKTPKGHLNKTAIDTLIARAASSILVPAEQLVFDLWSNSEGGDSDRVEEPDNNYNRKGILIGAAQKGAVEFCRQLAAAAGIKILSLELRSLAAINGLLFHWHESQEENIAVVYLEDDYADIGIMDSDGLISLQSVNTESNHGHNHQGSQSDNLSEHLSRVFNTVRLSHSHCAPERIFLAQDDNQDQNPAEERANNFRNKLGIEVSFCTSLQEVFTLKEPSPENISKFIPALGAALDGLEVSPTWFNLLHPRGSRVKKKKHLSWKPFAFLALAAVVLTCVFWISLVQQKYQALRDLKDQLVQTNPNLEITRQAREKWNLFHSYLPAASGGTRRSYLLIVGEISQLFPDTESAHVTRLEIISKSGATAGYNISIAGNVSESMVLNDFVARLNGSQMFQEVKQAGTTLVPGNLYYPYSFSVTCNLRPTRQPIKEYE